MIRACVLKFWKNKYEKVQELLKQSILKYAELENKFLVLELKK